MQAIRVNCQVFRTWESKQAIHIDLDVQPYLSVAADADPWVVGVIVRQLSGPGPEEADKLSACKKPRKEVVDQHHALRSKLAPTNPR